MRLKNIVRSAVTGGVALGLALTLASCSRDYTVAYVYSVSAATGGISAYAVDYETGILSQIAGSPFATPFTNPTTVVAAPNDKFIYVIGGSQNAQVEEFAVGTDGKLYGANTYNLTGTIRQNTNGNPNNITAAIDPTGTYLYVPYTYQIGFSTSSPGPGGVDIFPINQKDNSLGAPINVNVGNDPVAVAVSTPVCVPSASALVPGNSSCTGLPGGGSGVNNVYVYVLDQEVNTGHPAAILGFAQNQSTGGVTPLAGTTLNAGTSTYSGYSAGVTPSDIVVDGTARFVYVTDQEENQLYGYEIARTTSGALTPLSGSPFGTGQFPVNVVVDPRAEYVYTANYNSSTISSFVINQSTGNLSTVAGSNFTTGTNPTCVTIDPSLGQYVYSSDYEGALLSGGNLNANTGAVTAVLDSPFPTTANPACLTSVSNGPHAVQTLTP